MCSSCVKCVNSFGKVKNFANTHCLARKLILLNLLYLKGFSFRFLPNHSIKYIPIFITQTNGVYVRTQPMETKNYWGLTQAGVSLVWKINN